MALVRLAEMPGPGDFPLPEERCSRSENEECGYVEWCDLHDQEWILCGGREPREPDADA